MDKFSFSCFEEFGWNISRCLPIAYGYFLQGKLSFTESFIGSSPFFYFSPDHIEINRRAKKADSYNSCMNDEDFHPSCWDELWTPPPLKSYYKNNEFIYEKPLLVINNKFSSEGGTPSQPSSFHIHCHNFFNLKAIVKNIQF